MGAPYLASGSARNVVLPHATLSWLIAWPTGQSQPLASTLNSIDGRVKANAAIVAAGTGGAVSAIAANDTDVIFDVNGYFATSGAGSLLFYPVIPCRLADTRNASGPLGGPSLAPGSGRTFPIQSGSCGAPTNAQAYSLNLTAIPQGSLGYITTWPTGQSQPVVSTLNAPTGAVTANAAIVPAGTNGAVDVFATDATDLLQITRCWM